MTRWYTFLRAINVGGRRMTNDELLRPFHDLGLADAAAYQAAGNVTFVSDEPDAARLAAELAEVLPRAYGIECAAFLRSADEMRVIAQARPFSAAELARTAGRVQVAFMHATPDDDVAAEVSAIVPDADRVVIGGSPEWWWLPVEGISTSSLPVGTIERLVGPMTIRTRATIERMVGKFGT